MVRGPDGAFFDPKPGWYQARRGKAVFIANLLARDYTRHAVCLDTRSDPPFSYDSIAESAMMLTPEYLRVCVGDDTTYTRIENVRQLRVLPVRESAMKKVRTRTRALRN